MKNPASYLGCLIGGAAGDALGTEVELSTLDEIRARFGNEGITEYAFHSNVAEISDDTQLSLFTATGLMSAYTISGEKSAPQYSQFVWKSYQGWLRTQEETHPSVSGKLSWLLSDKRLYSKRVPGKTCLSVLEGGVPGTPEKPVNDARTCGAVMRIAPVGLWVATTDATADQTARLGSRLAALTHGSVHARLAAALHALIIKNIISLENKSLYSIVLQSTDELRRNFETEKELQSFASLIYKALDITKLNIIDDSEAIKLLGEGWEAVEAVAIAIYCAVKHSDDFERAVIASVNHDGDSDSVGTLCGNIIGAYLGIDRIPDKFKEKLELSDLITEISTDLFTAKPNASDIIATEKWNEKYIDCDFRLYVSDSH